MEQGSQGEVIPEGTVLKTEFNPLLLLNNPVVVKDEVVPNVSTPKDRTREALDLGNPHKSGKIRALLLMKQVEISGCTHFSSFTEQK